MACESQVLAGAVELELLSLPWLLRTCAAAAASNRAHVVALVATQPLVASGKVTAEALEAAGMAALWPNGAMMHKKVATDFPGLSWESLALLQALRASLDKAEPQEAQAGLWDSRPASLRDGRTGSALASGALREVCDWAHTKGGMSPEGAVAKLRTVSQLLVAIGSSASDKIPAIDAVAHFCVSDEEKDPDLAGAILPALVEMGVFSAADIKAWTASVLGNDERRQTVVSAISTD